MLRSLDAVLLAFVLLCLQMCSGSVWYFAAYWAAVFVPGVGIVWVALAGSGGVQSGVFLQDVGVGILCSACFHGLYRCSAAFFAMD